MKNWILNSAAVVVIVPMISSCGLNNLGCVQGKGDLITETRTTDFFHEIRLDGSADIYLKQSSDIENGIIEIEGQQNIVDILNTDVVGGQLIIDFDKQCVSYSKRLVLTITTKDLSEIKLRGSGDIVTLTKFEGDDLLASISGSGDMELELNYNDVDTEINGSGCIDLYGEGYSLDIDIDGSGDIDGFEFPVNRATVSISGSGDAKVNVSDHLKVDINGSGDVYYRGTPSTEVDIDGSGDVRHDG